MLTLTIPAQEMFDSEKEEFFYIPDTELRLEHSLLSIKKWEEKWQKPFLKDDVKPKSLLEMQDYVRCMTINQHVDPRVYRAITQEQLVLVHNYMNDPMSATTFSNTDPNAGKGKKETITAELMYFWLSAYQIPFEVEKWHLNQMLNLVRIASIKNQDPTKNKMSKRNVMRQNSALNAARRKKLGSKG